MSIGKLAYCGNLVFFRMNNRQEDFWLSMKAFPEDYTEGDEAVFTPQWFRYDGYKRMVVPAMFWSPKATTELVMEESLIADYVRVADRYRKPVQYNLGCGRDYLSGWVNCDQSKQVTAERYFDLQEFPWPIDSDSADEILMDNVLEHLDPVPVVMDEIWRVLKPSGTATIIVPYAKSDWSLQDVTHRHSFTEYSLNPFLVNPSARDWKGRPTADFYSARKFIPLKIELFTAGKTWRHKMRSAIPFRNVLRYFFFNLYDGVRFELRKPLP